MPFYPYAMGNNLQRQIFERILQNFIKKSSAVESISKLLGIGKDAVYRRFRGDTLLTPDELVLLCRKFNISMDRYIYDDADTIFFKYNPISRPIEHVDDYFSFICNDLESITKLPNAEVFYASSEIPIFYYCSSPELISFKLYVWGRTIWNLQYLQNQSFHFDLFSHQTLALATNMSSLYNKIPSTELWSNQIVDYTLSQIEYVAKSGGFKDKSDALLIYSKLEELMDHLKNMAYHGKKFRPNQSPEFGTEFQLYHNEMVYTNNTILVRSKNGHTIYSSYCNPNFLKSSDENLYRQTNEWFQHLFQKSNSISKHSEKERNWFFNKLKTKIASSREHIIF